MSAPESVIRSWVIRELARWRGQSLIDPYWIRSEFIRMNAVHESVFLYRIADGIVSLEDKPIPYPDSAKLRSQIYLDFIQGVVTERNLVLRSTIAFDVYDKDFPRHDVPMFNFQKTVGSHSILFPDIEFLTYGFYESEDLADTTPFADKSDSAIFVGSTTGAGTIDLHKVKTLAVPRLRSAVYFKSEPLVDFRIQRIVQCESSEVEDEIRALGFEDGHTAWGEQFKNKFIISLDGNGATCSRVVTSLKSNSVLLKYHSNELLYYFDGLIPWHNFVPIRADQEIPLLVRAEKYRPGLMEFIARNGAEFFENYLTRARVMDYTSMLLSEYSEIFGDLDLDIGARP